MPARDRYHDAAKRALVQDGWTITHDPMQLRWGKKDMYVDLGAERLLGAEKGSRKIAVEIKSFLSNSEMRDLEVALGQATLYELVLGRREPDRVLYLAVREETYREVFEEPIGLLMVEAKKVRLVVFDESREVITRWVP